jgi:hypothetical protein
MQCERIKGDRGADRDGDPSSSLEHLYLRFAGLSSLSIMPPSVGPPLRSEDDGGYKGKNMTLPASWWTSTSLFNLERRAIFAKVPSPRNVADGRLGFTQHMHRTSSRQETTVLSVSQDSPSSSSKARTDKSAHSTMSVDTAPFPSCKNPRGKPL